MNSKRNLQLSLAAGLVACCAIPAAQATVLSTETFTGYTPGDISGQGSAIAGYTGNWTAADFGNQHILVSSTSAYVPTSISPSEIDASNSGRDYRLLDSTLAVNNTTVGSLYLGFLFQSGQETGATTYQTLSLGNGSTADGSQAIMFGLMNNGGLSGTSYGFGVYNANYTSTGVAADTGTHLLVARFDLSATAASDSVTFWVDPTSETGGQTVSGQDIAFDRLVLSDYDGNSASWDNITWGTTFADVAPVPEPSTMALAGFGGMALLFLRQRNKR